MMELNKMLKELPPMKSGKELDEALEVLPFYDESIRRASTAIRLLALSDLYEIYIPSTMSREIYSKLYLSMLRSLQKKCTQLSVQQRYENHKAIMQKEYRGIIGGADSFSIFGSAGIGKSSAIQRAVTLMTENRLIEVVSPHTKIIPSLTVQCPFDASVKGLLLEILRKVDEELGSTYYLSAVKSRAATTDMLIGMVSTVALNHVGLLVVDEIENVVASKNGRNLIGALTQIINSSGISICMVGTPEAEQFFETALHLARRALGLNYTTMSCDAFFMQFCEIVWRYQYVAEKTELTPALIEWLYEHSNGITALVISLIHDAQEIAILSGTERLDLDTLNEAYRHRLNLLHGFTNIVRGKQCSRMQKKETVKLPTKTMTVTTPSISELVAVSKESGVDVVQLLREHFAIVEVVV